MPQGHALCWLWANSSPTESQRQTLFKQHRLKICERVNVVSITFHTTESPHTVRVNVLTSSSGYRQADSKDGVGSHSNSLQVPSRTWLSLANCGRTGLASASTELAVGTMTAAPEKWLLGLPFTGSAGNGCFWLLLRVLRQHNSPVQFCQFLIVNFFLSRSPHL